MFIVSLFFHSCIKLVLRIKEHVEKTVASIHVTMNVFVQVVDQPISIVALQNSIDANVIAKGNSSRLINVQDEAVAWRNFRKLIVVQI